MFRILTENRNVNDIKKALARFGLDYTLFMAEGSWNGCQENSIAIELDNIPRSCAEAVAITIKSMNQQQAVLVQEIPATSVLI